MLRRHHKAYSTIRFSPTRREYRTKCSCEEQGVKYRTKAIATSIYREHCTSRSSGWKDKKFKKQYEHNLINKKIIDTPISKLYKDIELDSELFILKYLDTELDVCAEDFIYDK